MRCVQLWHRSQDTRDNYYYDWSLFYEAAFLVAREVEIRIVKILLFTHTCRILPWSANLRSNNNELDYNSEGQYLLDISRTDRILLPSPALVSLPFSINIFGTGALVVHQHGMSSKSRIRKHPPSLWFAHQIIYFLNVGAACLGSDQELVNGEYCWHTKGTILRSSALFLTLQEV